MTLIKTLTISCNLKHYSFYHFELGGNKKVKSRVSRGPRLAEDELEKFTRDNHIVIRGFQLLEILNLCFKGDENSSQKVSAMIPRTG